MKHALVIFPMPITMRAILFAISSIAAFSQVATPPRALLVESHRRYTLSEPVRMASINSEHLNIRFQHGYFFSAQKNGRVRIWDTNGKLTGDFSMQPSDPSNLFLVHMHDAAMLQDGSIVGSFAFVVKDNNTRYFALIHYSGAGEFIDRTDLGRWRALEICTADDGSIWTLSDQEEEGRVIYSPVDNILRNYKLRAGLVRSAVAWSNFPNHPGNYASNRAGITCTGKKVHVLTNDYKLIDYTPGGDLAITDIPKTAPWDQPSDWILSGFAYLNDSHIIALIRSSDGNPTERMLAELQASDNGRQLQWVEVPMSASSATREQAVDIKQSHSAITELLGVDNTNNNIVYGMSGDERFFWSKLLGQGP